ncbi:MAG: AMP-binding protein [Rhodospirillales bacterium]|nr:AMP-binding protein [Rhodospirillales bacterium]
MTSSPYYDEQETRSPDARESAHMQALDQQISNAKANAPYFSRLLRDIDPATITDRAGLARLPVTRKSDLIAQQKTAMPFGGLTACTPGQLKRIFQSPGPIYDAEGFGDDWWRTARALYAAGIRRGDILHNCFSYHLTPAGVMTETGAAKLGCAVVPAGVGNTELQVRAIADIRSTGYLGTPSFLKIILEKAEEMGEDVSSLRKGVVGGEAFLPHQRQELADRGVHCGQIYASADIGSIAYESLAQDGLIVDEGLLVEIVRPGTGDLVAPGEVGEVVVTTFVADYPLIRFATGDLSAVMAGISPCGRTNMRLKGWMGRADQTTKVKGMFVHPKQIADIVNRHPDIIKARLIVDQRDGADVMTLSCEVDRPDEVAGGDSSLLQEIATSIQAVCKLRGEVGFATPGSLPNDGKVIDDIRKLGG